MSGICGIVFRDKEQRLTPALLIPMVRALDPSGQEEGFTVTLGRVSLGAQAFSGRLAGVSRLSLYGESMALAFHGSLYNPRELFPTEKGNLDPSEGLLNLYIKEGMGLLKRLRGEFVLAIWDGREEALYLATDRFRVHPLFYYQDHEKLLFASRMKSILACPLPVLRTVNPEAVVDVVASSIIPAPKTIFREVKKLLPGHFLKHQRGEVKIEPYWEISFLRPSRESESVLARKFKSCLDEAVFLSLEVDKNSNRAGTFLSGGVDSSTVTGLLTQRVGHPVKSFSIGFDEPHYNEMEYARIAARAFGAEHYEYFVNAKDTYDVFPVLLEGFDEPYGNASAVPAYFCAKLAKEKGVDFLYAGDGGDELFAGNERYGSQRVFDYYYKFPAWLREGLVKPTIFTLAHGLKWGLFRKGEKYILPLSNVVKHT
jgi:asparagine synthase (glutamine-hydrolysing)